MNSTGNTNGLLSVLKVLDTRVEMETDATNNYKKLAHESEKVGARALFAWLYNTERARLIQLTERKRAILSRHPGLIEDGGYKPREDTGLSKTGWHDASISNAMPLDILRYAIDNEMRAYAFYRRKAATVRDETQRRMFSVAAGEQKDRIDYLGAHRKLLMQQLIEYGTKELAGAAV